MFDPARATDSFAPHVPDLIKAVVSFLWLTLAAFAFFRFYGSLKSAIDSRSLSIDIGGFKLSFPEAAEGLKKQVADLQEKLADLELSVNQGRALHSDLHPPSLPPAQPLPPPPQALSAEPPQHAILEDPPRSRDLRLHVLWVDDHPKGNAYEIEAITSAGGTVETARSTVEALSKFEAGRFDAVITDLGRRFSGSAGLDLIQAIRRNNRQIPIFVYTGAAQASQNQQQVAQAGANGITASPVELFEMLRSSNAPRR